jgi:hypothetical protein
MRIASRLGLMTIGSQRPAWLSAFAPWASYAYGTTGLTTPQYYNMSLAETRAGEALKLNAAGVYVGIPANTPLILGGVGHDVFRSYTQYFLNDTAPVNQTITLPATGSYTLHVFGTGSAAVAAGTATISNAGSADASASRTIGCTGTGTVSITITGSPTRVWFTNTAFAVPPVTTAGSPVTRNASISTVTGQPALGDFRIKLREDIPDLSNRTFWSRGTSQYDEVRLSMVSGKIRQTVTKLGPELFTGFTNADTGWTIGGDPKTAAKVGTGGSVNVLQNGAGEGNKSYLIDWDILTYTGSGAFRPVAFGSSADLGIPEAAVGNYVSVLSTSTGNVNIGIRGTAPAAGEVRINSIREITTPVLIETDAYTSAPGIVEIEAIAADGNQSISATGRTGATDTVAVTIPAGTIERFGGLGGTTFPNVTNMDFAVGPA